MVNNTLLLSLGQGESPEPISPTHVLITVDYQNATNLDQFLIAHLGPKRWELYKVIPVTIVYCVIFVTGIIGNVSTCIVIARNKYMHTATNYYLFNLAVADLLVLVLGLPLETHSFWQAYPWIFGDAFCVIRTMAAETSTYASILTITAFTVERYVAICHPMRAQTMSSLKRAIKVIVLLWIVSVVCSIPMVLQFGVVYLKLPDGTSIPQSATCKVDGRKALDHIFEIATFLFFLTPMTVITVLYAMIGLAIKRSALSRAGSDTSTQNGHPGRDLRSRQQAHARRSVLKMLVAVVVAFFICWAPFHLQRLMVIYIKKDKWTDSMMLFQKILYYVSGILYYVSTTINPILYNTMSLKFRQAFKNTIFRPCKRKKKRRRLTTYKFYNKPPTDTNMTLVQGQPFLKFQRLRRGLANNAVPFVSDPKSNSSSVSAGSARVLDTPHDGIELDPILAEYKSHSFQSPQNLTINRNCRPYHSFT